MSGRHIAPPHTLRTARARRLPATARPLSYARRRPGVLLRLVRLGFVATLAGTMLASFAIATNAAGAGDRFEHLVARVERFLAGPPPDRPTQATIVVTPRPVAASASVAPSPAGAGTEPSSSIGTLGAAARQTASPAPVRRPVDLNVVHDPQSVFASELRKDWCAPAGVQIVLSFLGHGDTSDAFQQQLAGRVHEWESYADSHNGDWGPAAMAGALTAYGAPGYEIRAYAQRADALRDLAAAIEATGAPAILLAWRGAHTWVMSGFRADADPARFPDATVSGAYVLDPWYPRVSSIWGSSDPPGTFQDSAEMVRNYLPWKRPEGRYPDRDGLFIALAPTVPVPGWRAPSP